MFDKRIHIIDVLRFFAVLIVVLFHFFPKYFSFGYIGVDIFLVISGFVIAKSVKNIKGKNPSLTFLKKRIFRLFPNLIFISLITLLVFLFLYPESLYSLLFLSFTSSLSVFSNLYYGTVSGYFDIVSEINPLLHSWSLSLEWQFYIITTLLIFFFNSKKKIFYFILLLSMVSICWMFYYSGSRPTLNFYSFWTRFFEFGLGFVAFSFSNSFRGSFILRVILFISFIFLYLNNGFDSASWPNINTVFLVLIVILTILNDIKFNFHNKYVKKIVLWISDRSYSIYLVHYPFAAYYKYINFDPKDSYLIILVFIAILFLSDLTFRFIENKFRYSFSKRSTSLSLLIIPSFLILFLFSYNSKPHEDKYGDYVKNQFNSLNSFNETNKIYLIGDSFAQDFLNILIDGLDINSSSLNTKFIDMNCGNLNIDSNILINYINNDFATICNNKIQYDEVFKTINDRDVMIIASNWPSWTTDLINESILNIRTVFSGKIIIVGTKHIGKQNPFQISQFPLEIRKNLRSSPPSYVKEINNNILTKIQDLNNVTFFDIQSLFLDTEQKGIVCDLNGNIISYDGGHLTKEGVKFISNKIPINILNILNEKN